MVLASWLHHLSSLGVISSAWYSHILGQTDILRLYIRLGPMAQTLFVSIFDHFLMFMCL